MCFNIFNAISFPVLVDFMVESFATFLFVIIFGMTYSGLASLVETALAVGLGAAVLIASEEADLNPIVSMAVALSDPKMGWKQLFTRVLAQLLGAIIGGLVSVTALRAEFLDFSENATSTSTKALVFEIVFSCFLVLVVLRTREADIGAFTHGLCYTVAIFCGQKVFSGNPMINPATAIGLLTGSVGYSKTSTDESYIWLYLVGPFIGALIAVVIYQLTEYFSESIKDDEEESADEDETTEYVGTTVTTVVRPAEHVQPKPQVVAQQPMVNGYGQQPAVNVHEPQKIVNTVPRGTPVQEYGQRTGVTPVQAYGQRTGGTRYTTEMVNTGGQNRFVQQPQYIR